jgi:hypothetical protein
VNLNEDAVSGRVMLPVRGERKVDLNEHVVSGRVAKKVDVVDEDAVARKVDVDEDMVDVDSNEEEELGEVVEDEVVAPLESTVAPTFALLSSFQELIGPMPPV